MKRESEETEEKIREGKKILARKEDMRKRRR